jgi:type I restriction enzyme, S subunit
MTWGEFRQDENKAVPSDREIDVRHEIKPGDILLSRANTENYVGAAVLVRDTRPNLLLSDKSLRLILKQSVNPIWLTDVLASPAVRSQISARATGMKDSMRNISQKSLREIRVPRATQEQQAQVVEALSGLRVETSRLRSQVDAAERRQDLLRGSLLRDAFAGRLAPQDPDDEPASVLLERIKAERVAQPQPKRARRNTNPDQERML